MRRLIGCIAASTLVLLPAAVSAAPAKRKPVARAAAKPAVPAVPRIGFTVISEGKGANPGATDIVLVAYIGRLPNGTIFDQNPQAALPVDGVVTGFGDALKRMKVGGVYHITIPPSLAYGDRATGDIPANSTLVFDIMLFDFKTSAEVEAMTRRMEAEDAAAAEKPKPATP